MYKDRVGEAYRDEICAWWGDECPVGCIRCMAEKLATIEAVENDAVGKGVGNVSLQGRDSSSYGGHGDLVNIRTNLL